MSNTIKRLTNKNTIIYIIVLSFFLYIACLPPTTKDDYFTENNNYPSVNSSSPYNQSLKINSSQLNLNLK